jgi:hypothetical protein
VREALVDAPPRSLDLEDAEREGDRDFRQSYAAVLEEWLGLRATEVPPGSFERLLLGLAAAAWLIGPGPEIAPRDMAADHRWNPATSANTSTSRAQSCDAYDAVPRSLTAIRSTAAVMANCAVMEK